MTVGDATLCSNALWKEGRSSYRTLWLYVNVCLLALYSTIVYLDKQNLRVEESLSCLHTVHSRSPCPVSNAWGLI